MADGKPLVRPSVRALGRVAWVGDGARRWQRVMFNQQCNPHWLFEGVSSGTGTVSSVSGVSSGTGTVAAWDDGSGGRAGQDGGSWRRATVAAVRHGRGGGSPASPPLGLLRWPARPRIWPLRQVGVNASVKRCTLMRGPAALHFGQTRGFWRHLTAMDDLGRHPLANGRAALLARDVEAAEPHEQRQYVARVARPTRVVVAPTCHRSEGAR